jgi:hypothetical protein
MIYLKKESVKIMIVALFLLFMIFLFYLNLAGFFNNFFKDKISEEEGEFYSLLGDDEKRLIAYYSFESDASDDSGNGNHGTLGGDAEISGGLLNLDGEGDYVKVNNNVQLNPKQITVSVWVYPLDSEKENKYIITKGDSWKIHHTRTFTRGAMGYMWNDATNKPVHYGILEPNQWHHVLMTYDGEYVRGYLDGELKESNRLGGDIRVSAYDLFIGRSTEPLAYFNGSLDEIKIWNYALNESEIEKEYERYIPGLIAYYPFESDANDSSGNENHGTLKGDAEISEGVLNLDGEGDYVEIPDKPDLESSNNKISMTSWIKINSDKNMYILGKGDNTLDIGSTYKFGIWDSCLFARLGNGTLFKDVVSDTLLNSSWYYVSFVWNGSQCRLYLDGILDKTSDCLIKDLVDSDNPMYLGTEADGNGLWLNGSLEDLKIWNYALNENAILQEYNEERCFDNDGDGYSNVTSFRCGELDCNDSNANINPGVSEDCETLYDDDCDGQINEGCVIVDDGDDDGSGGGGGGGGSASSMYWLSTFVIGNTRLEEGFSKELGIRERIKITLDEDYYIGVTKLSTNLVINFSSFSEEVPFTIGQEKKFDLTEDGYYDLIIKLKGIKNGKGNLTFDKINELIYNESEDDYEDSEPEDNPPEEDSEKNRSLTKYLFLVLLIFLVLIILFIIILIIRRPSSLPSKPVQKQPEVRPFNSEKKEAVIKKEPVKNQPEIKPFNSEKKETVFRKSVDYIRNSRKKGVKDIQLRQAFQRAGWTKEDIDFVFLKADSFFGQF